MKASKAIELIAIRAGLGETYPDVAEVLKGAVESLGERVPFDEPQMVSRILPMHDNGLLGGLKAIYLVGKTVVEVQAYPNPQASRKPPKPPLTEHQYRKALRRILEMEETDPERMGLIERVEDYEQRQEEKKASS